MNVRRINAAKNFRNVSKFVVIITLLIFLFIISLINSNDITGKQEKKEVHLIFWVKHNSTAISLSSYTCDQIYDLQLNHTLYKDENKNTFEGSDVLIYWLKNCK